MHKIKKESALGRIISIIPDYARLPLLFCGITDLIAYYLPRLLGVNGAPQRFYVEKLDGVFPLIPAFSYIYLVAFIFWTINYIYISRQSRRLCLRLVFADTVAKAVCLFCFMAYPATIAQPDISQNSDIGAWLLRIIYALDEPNNLLPSIHCFVSWLTFRPMLSKDAKGVPVWYKAFSFVFAIAICFSTLFTKQHFVHDFITGVLVAEIGWLLSRFMKTKDL